MGERDDGIGRRDVAGSLFGAAGYFLLAWGTVALTSEVRPMAAVWPQNALLLAMLLPLAPSRWPIFVAAAFLAAASADYARLDSIPGALIGAATSMIEVMVAAALLRGSIAASEPFHDVRSILLFVLSAFAAAIVGALGAAVAAHAFDHNMFWITFQSRHLADALGLILFAPLFMTALSGGLPRWYDGLGRRGRVEAVIIFLIVALIALLIFRYARNPLLFLMSAPLLLTIFRLGPVGTTLSLILLATMASQLTMAGEGPIARAFAELTQRSTFLQLYLLLVLLTTLPVAADLNARRRLARQLSESEESLRLLASSSADMLVRLDHRGRCVQASGNAALLAVRHGVELIGSRLSAFAEDADTVQVETAFSAAFVSPGSVSRCEFRPLGRPTDYLECTMRALIDDEGRSYGVVGAIRDISLRKEREQTLALAASTDSLTGALNHAAFMRHLDRLMSALPSSNLSLLMIDVDRFKSINDSFGHLAGDQVLVELHNRLRALLRDHDVIGRLGGDELAIVLDGTSPELAKSIADALRIAVSSDPVVLGDGERLVMSLSCGVAQAKPGMTRHELIKRADEALYIAKNNGRDCVAMHSPSDSEA